MLKQAYSGEFHTPVSEAQFSSSLPPFICTTDYSQSHGTNCGTTGNSAHPTNSQCLTILLQEVQRIPIALLAHVPQHLWAEEGDRESFGNWLSRANTYLNAGFRGILLTPELFQEQVSFLPAFLRLWAGKRGIASIHWIWESQHNLDWDT